MSNPIYAYRVTVERVAAGTHSGVNHIPGNVAVNVVKSEIDSAIIRNPEKCSVIVPQVLLSQLSNVLYYACVVISGQDTDAIDTAIGAKLT